MKLPNNSISLKTENCNINSLFLNKNGSGNISRNILATSKKMNSKKLLRTNDIGVKILRKSRSNYKGPQVCINNRNGISLNSRGMSNYQPTHNRNLNKSCINSNEKFKVNELTQIYVSKSNNYQLPEHTVKNNDLKFVQLTNINKLLKVHKGETLNSINKNLQLPVTKSVISKKSTKFNTSESCNLEEGIEEMHMVMVSHYQKIYKVLKRVELRDIEEIDCYNSNNEVSV